MKKIIKINLFFIIILIVYISLIYIIPNAIQLKKSYDLFHNKYPSIPFYSEYGERLNAYNNIEETDIVLEIGGNIGSTSLIIADKLSNSKNLVVIEPSKKATKQLRKNKKQHNHNFNIFEGCLSKIPLYEKKKSFFNLSYWTNYLEVTNDSNKGTHTISTATYKELEELYNLQFNTVVIDCEGCYRQIFNEFPEILKKVDKILIEWDGVFMEDELLKNGFHKIAHYHHPFLLKGIATYKKI